MFFMIIFILHHLLSCCITITVGTRYNRYSGHLTRKR
nr:MAG TPA: hypothetical protein [Bacteriophage sp.]